MVSFFGLKFGGDKKRKGTSPPTAAAQWEKVDQNQLGEGQFFGKDAQRKGTFAGSIRSVVRPGTARVQKSPYDLPTHNLAASSMYDLAQAGASRSRAGSRASLKPFASDANLRTRFANGSSASLAPPSPSFAAGGGGFPRPGTSHSSRTTAGTKPWVNPLDVHFGRPATPSSGPPGGSRSPLGQFELPPTPGGGGGGGGGDSSSLFGDLMPEAVAEEISNKVALAQEEARAKADADARARARAELEEQARRNAEATRSPAQASFPASPPLSTRGGAAERPPLPPLAPGGLPSPRFQGAAAREGRPGSRNGERRVVTPAAAGEGRPGSRNGERRVMTPSGRDGRAGLRPRDPRDREPRAATPTNHHGAPKYHAGPHGLPSPPSSHGTRPSEDQASTGSSAGGSVNESGNASGSGSADSNAIASASTNNMGGSGRPVIQNVRAKRDTLQLHPPRRRSLTMKIEELELSLVTAQEAFMQKGQHKEPQQPQQQAPQQARVVSASSSYYGDDEPADVSAFGSLLSPLSPREEPPSVFPPSFAQSSSPRPQSPMGWAARAARPAPGEYSVPIARRTDSPMGRAAAAPPPRVQNPARGGAGARNQSPAPTAAAIAAATAGEGTALRPRRRPKSPVPRPLDLQSVPGPGARSQSRPGRAAAGGREARPKRRPKSPIRIPPRGQSPAGYAVRGQSPMEGPRPRSPLGLGIGNQSPKGRGGMDSPGFGPLMPMSPMGGDAGRRPGGPGGPGDEIPFPRNASGPGKTADNGSGSSSSNDSGGGLAFRQPNWDSPASTPQSSVPATPTIPGEPSSSANWPLPAPQSPTSSPPSGALPAVPSHHQRRARPPPLNIASARYADDVAAAGANLRGPWTPQVRPGGMIGSPTTATAAAAEDGEMERPATAGAAGRKLSPRGAEEDQQPRGRPWRRPNYGLKSPTGIADEHGTGFI